jgi:hypothetical protein
VAEIKIAKTRRVDPAFGVGESYDPATEPTPTQFPLGPGATRNSSFSNRFLYDYPFDEETRRKRAFEAQLSPGTSYAESPAPSFRDDLAQLIGQGAADTAVDWTPAYGLDWFDRTNQAVQSRDPSEIAWKGGEGATIAALGPLLAKYGPGLAKGAFRGLKRFGPVPFAGGYNAVSGNQEE